MKVALQGLRKALELVIDEKMAAVREENTSLRHELTELRKELANLRAMLAQGGITDTATGTPTTGTPPPSPIAVPARASGVRLPVDLRKGWYVAASLRISEWATKSQASAANPKAGGAVDQEGGKPGSVTDPEIEEVEKK